MGGGAPMRNSRVVSFSLIGAAMLIGACQRQPEAPAERTDSGTQARMELITIEGCLKSGVLADGTWVVLGRTAQNPAETAATYQLVGGDGASLRAHQNRVVRVSGTLEADRRVMTSTGLVPEDDK